jgi:hypothetical protein
MVGVPSHRVHAIVGEFICGVTLGDVDRLVDLDREHDLSGVSCRELLSQASLVYERHGARGLCYLVTHHYIDKLASVMRGRVVKLFIEKRFSLGDLVEEVKSGLEDEVSVLALLTRHLDLKRPDLKTLLQQYLYYRDLKLEDNATIVARYFTRMLGVDYSGYSRRTANKKARMLTKIALECVEALENTSGQLVDLLVEESSRARWRIIGNVEKVICTILTVDSQHWRHYWGKNYYDHLIEHLKCVKEM